MSGIECKILIKRFLCIFLISIFLVSSFGCEKKGLITEKYHSDFYRVPKLLTDSSMEKNPRFIIYGDSQFGWRIKEKFLKRENWLTWKMLIFPFYEVYWLGNGVIGGVNRLRHVPDYGSRERRMVRYAIYTEAKQSGVDFIFHIGDMPDDGRRPSDWAMFLNENKKDPPLVSDFPFFTSIGNHEKANDSNYGLPNYKAIFEHPRFYVLDFPDAAIFVVDSNLILDQYKFIDDDRQDALFQKWFVSGEHSENPSWLERELASRNKLFKIVVMHHPPISFGRHHTDWTKPKWGRDLQQKRQQLLDLFHQQGVKAVFSGHEHIYEHSIIRYPAHADRGESKIHIIIGSGGGVPLRRSSDAKKVEKFRQSYRAEGLDVVMMKQEEINHYCLVDIASDKITIQVLEVPEKPTQPVRLADKILIPK